MITNNFISFAIPYHRINPETRISEPGFREDDFRTDLIGTSDCNSFIPIIGLLNHNLITFDETINILEYSMPVANPRGGYFRSYERLMDTFQRGNIPYLLKFKVAGVEHHLYVHRGIIYDSQGNILMCLALEREYGMSYNFLSSTIEESKVVVFISTMFDQACYKNVRKKIDTLYLDRLRGLGIDIVNTVRINNWFFNNNFELPKFKNINESLKHLREEVPKNLLID